MIDVAGIASAILLAQLPKPPDPGSPSSSSLSDLAIIFTVAAIVGALLIIAWLLKPVVERRLKAVEANRGQEAETQDEVPASWESAWSIKGGSVPMPPLVTEHLTRREHLLPEMGTEHRFLHTAAFPDSDASRSASTSQVDIVLEQHPSLQRKVEPCPSDHEVNTETVIGITLTVRELLDHANSGRLLRGFDLYTESYFRRFKEESGLSGEEFDAAFKSGSSPEPEARTELGAVLDVQPEQEGRVRAVVVYTGTESAPPSEQFTFVRSKEGDRWLIDDIATMG